MFFRIREYLKFLFKSTNQHGVHSPFVYDLVTKCFYEKKKRESYAQVKQLSKKAKIKYHIGKLLNRIPHYFDHKNALVIDDPYDFIAQILSCNNAISIDKTIQPNTVYDLVYLNIGQLQRLLDDKSLLSILHNDSILLVHSIHCSETNIILWEKIKKKSGIKVTINSFYLGFLFIRKEQAKEHFTIRV